MNDLVNETIIPMVNDGKISIERLNQLIYIKEFIDRISTNNYIKERDLESLNTKYGVIPSVITWGDYFQAELATDLLDKSDQVFNKVVETVKYDMISSYIIFSEKERDFFDWVEECFVKISKKPEDDYTEDDEEIVHLHVLMNYYVGLGIVNTFTDNEMTWHNDFKEPMAI